jgi:hypothetical protein
MALAVASPVPKKAAATTSASACGSAATTAASTATAAASTATTAAVSAAAAGGNVLAAAAYNTFQISSGTAGTAETEANALFANIDMNNLAAVSAADLKVIKGIHDAAEDAEVQAFNPAIAAASGSAATALQVIYTHPFRWNVQHTNHRTTERQDKEQGPQAHC